MSFARAGAVDGDEFRTAMRRLAGAVNIVTARHEDQLAGMTATAVCSVSAEPPTLLVCINQSTTTHATVLASGGFCVNILRAEDHAVSVAFGGAVTSQERFAGREWHRLQTGAPVFAGALCSFDCRVSDRIKHGTHSVFLGEIQAIAFGRRGRPLLYADGAFARLAGIEHVQRLPEGADAWGFG